MENKENIIFKPSLSILRHTNSRRPRSRTKNTSLVVVRAAPRKLHRHYAQSSPATYFWVRFPIDDTAVEMSDNDTPTPSEPQCAPNNTSNINTTRQSASQQNSQPQTVHYTQSPPATQSWLRFPIDDADVEMLMDRQVTTTLGSNCTPQNAFQQNTAQQSTPQQNRQQRTVQRTVQLPRILKRAPFQEVTSEAIEAVDSALKDVALGFILDNLKAIGPQYVLTFSKDV
jgi:hypothetical protein